MIKKNKSKEDWKDFAWSSDCLGCSDAKYWTIRIIKNIECSRIMILYVYKCIISSSENIQSIKCILLKLKVSNWKYERENILNNNIWKILTIS